MEIKVNGKNVEVSDDLLLYAKSKINKLVKYSNKLLAATISLSEQSSRKSSKTHRAEVVLHTKGRVLNAKEESESFFISIDAIVDKLKRQLKKEKTKRLSKHREQPGVIVEQGNLEVKEAEPRRPLAVKKFTLKPMAVEEAIMQLDSSKHGFYLFVSTDQTINCVYKREDGGYGLLVPETSLIT